MTHHEEAIYAFGENPVEIHCLLNPTAQIAMFGLSAKWHKEQTKANEGVEPS